MNEDMKNNLEKIIEFTKTEGATTCDAILNTGKSFSLSAQKGEIDKYNVSGSHVIGVRAITSEGKIGISYTESFDDESLKFAAKSAVENAKNSDVNEFESIDIESEDIIFKSDFQDTASTQDKIDLCLKLEKEIKDRDSRVQAVPYNGYSDVESESYYMNSRGTFAYDDEFYTSCYTSALLHEGSENSMHYHGVIGRSLKELNVEECVKESLEHASNWLGAGPIKTGHYDVVFTTDQLQSLFGCFSNIFSAKRAWEKTNPFADKIGKAIGQSGLTIKDCPNYSDAFFKYKFDSEGVRRSQLTLVENGVLNSFYHNTATANYFKTETTGHASRGPRSALGVGGTNIVISAGNVNESKVLADEYLEIHAMQGLHSGANPISGEFSFGASGYWCRDGKRVKAVKGITVAGNFHHMLMNLNLIGDTVKVNGDNSFFAPVLRFSDMSIAGK